MPNRSARKWLSHSRWRCCPAKTPRRRRRSLQRCDPSVMMVGGLPLEASWELCGDEIAVTLYRAKDVKRTENNLDVIMAEVEIQARKDLTDVRVVSERTVEFG